MEPSQQLAEQSRRLFAEASRHPVTAPPELKAQVLARLRGATQPLAEPLSRDWYGFLLGATTALVAFVVMVRFGQWNPGERLATLTIDLPVPRDIRVQALEVTLPEGVWFHSERHKAVASRRHVALPVRDGMTALCVVLKGLTFEPRDVTLRFVDAEGALVQSRGLKVSASPAAGQQAALGLGEAAPSDVKRLRNATALDVGRFDTLLDGAGGK